jgi:hypothetical protein
LQEKESALKIDTLRHLYIAHSAGVTLQLPPPTTDTFTKRGLAAPIPNPLNNKLSPHLTRLLFNRIEGVSGDRVTFERTPPSATPREAPVKSQTTGSRDAL